MWRLIACQGILVDGEGGENRIRQGEPRTPCSSEGASAQLTGSSEQRRHTDAWAALPGEGRASAPSRAAVDPEAAS